MHTDVKMKYIHEIEAVQLTYALATGVEPLENIPQWFIDAVESGDIKKWACMKCPGGCGEVINLSLNPNQRPRWQVSEDFWLRPTVHPSIHQKNDCGCHFWIKNGEVQWCRGGRPRRQNIPPQETSSNESR